MASSVIILYLQVFIEFRFTEGFFPKSCTIARIVPIFKKEERDKPINYRPISILTCFSKIFEKLIYNLLLLKKNFEELIYNLIYLQYNLLNKHNVGLIINTQLCFSK